MKIFAPKYLLIFLIRVYRIIISPYLSFCCRFDPTCSAFAIEAIKKYGVLSGGWLAIGRLFRCHPFNKQVGHDPLQ